MKSIMAACGRARRVVRPAVIVCGIIVSAAAASDAKSPGATICYNDICHRVRTLEETRMAVGSSDEVVASYYSSPDEDRFNPRMETSSGEIFAPDRPDNVASPIWPDGTILLLWSPKSGVAAIARVNTAGPYWPGRTLDTSKALAERLGFKTDGTGKLMIRVLRAPAADEAGYRRNRVYPTVPGVIGQFASLDQAALASTSEMDSVATAGTHPRAATAVAAYVRLAEPPSVPDLVEPPRRQPVRVAARASDVETERPRRVARATIDTPPKRSDFNTNAGIFLRDITASQN